MIKLAIPILVDKDFTVYVDYASFGIIAHLDYHRWNKEVYKTSIPKIKEVAKKQKLPVYAEIYDVNDTKHIKFISRCGFVKSPLVTDEGHELYVWRE